MQAAPTPDEEQGGSAGQDGSVQPIPLRTRLNPCDYDSYPVLAPLGNALARVATSCPCCNGARILGALVLGLVVGAVVLGPVAAHLGIHP